MLCRKEGVNISVFSYLKSGYDYCLHCKPTRLVWSGVRMFELLCRKEEAVNSERTTRLTHGRADL